MRLEWLRVAAGASRIGDITEPDHAPNALVRGQGEKNGGLLTVPSKSSIDAAYPRTV